MYIFIFILEFVCLLLSSRFVVKTLSHLLYRVFKTQKAVVYILAVLFFPGVLIHELAHFFMAIILFVPVGDMEFFPKITPDGVKLGSLQIAKTDPFRRAVIGVAPVIIGILVIILGMLFFVPQIAYVNITKLSHIAAVLGGGYMLFAIGNTMFSSKKDLEGTLELVGVCMVLTAIGYFLGLRIPEQVFVFLNSFKVQEVFKTASIILLIPLGMNVVVGGIVLLIGNLRSRMFLYTQH